MKKVSLNEIMGKAGEKSEKGKFSLDDLQELLGERMPDVRHTPIGRMRLVNALKNRFGKNWRSLPGMVDLMKDFDKEMDFNVSLQKMKMIKGKK